MSKPVCVGNGSFTKRDLAAIRTDVPLRDRFAMAALTGLIAYHIAGTEGWSVNSAAQDAYLFADAMLAARDRALSEPDGKAQDG